jgi:hypothetical protein
MKKVPILILLVFISITSIVSSQGRDPMNREKLQFGLKAGLNYSNVYDERTDEFNADAKFGFVGGMFLHIPIGQFFGIQPEILFSQKGFKGNGRILGFDYSFTRTTNFIDIPLLLALKPADFITVVAGPQYSFLLSQKDVFESSIYSQSQEEVFKNDNIRKNILGFVAGIDIHTKYVVIGARMGLDMLNNNGDGTSSTPRYKNAWFQGTIGYTF